MAELILTEEERSADTYLEWDDAAIGKAVKKLALKIKDHKGGKAMASVACATMFACDAYNANAETLEMDLDGVTEGSTECGSYKILITRTGGTITVK